MPSLDAALIVLAGIALFAAFVNGALGYGFSSLTVPLALLFYANRIVNPAVVVIEVFLNLYVLFINRNGVPAVWKKVFPILIGLLPGIAVGAFVLASLQPGWIKTRDLRGNSTPHPAPGSRLAEAGPVQLVDRSPIWNGAGRPVFGNDHLRTSFSDFVQQSRLGQKRVSGRSRIGSRG
jgi:hypothetical protein